MLKYINSIIMAFVIGVVMSGCGGSEPKPSSSSAVLGMKNIYVSSKATYNGNIAQNIKTECKIDSQVIHWLQAYAKKQNINIVIDGKPTANDSVLKISITDAISQRAFGYGGHNKYVTISGKLYEGNKLKSSFMAARRSGGGYFGAYRSSCSVLGSCAKTLGRDTASWLKNPTDGAKLGDAYLIH
ncbi:MAG: hypothetical protein GXO30_07170 [Epsilonproteobacteria bacterium]|nr:hypothetical protein [Campylobacterota bacterium]